MTILGSLTVSSGASGVAVGAILGTILAQLLGVIFKFFQVMDKVILITKGCVVSASIEKRPDIVRILSLGDSHTLGFEVNQDQTYSAVCEQFLNGEGLKAEEGEG